MISENVEKALRDFLSNIPLHGIANDLSRRGDFIKVWNQVIVDQDVQNVIGKMLFIPSPIPDLGQGLTILKILDYLHGKEPRKKKFLFWTYQVEEPYLFDDIVQTKAKITAVEVNNDNEGPDYKVTYIYKTHNGQTQRINRKFGYDKFHAAMNGYTAPILDGYWRVGNSIPCHYRASHPIKHAISEPYNIRPIKHPKPIITNRSKEDSDTKLINNIVYLHCNLNIRYDLPEKIWKQVPIIYEEMPGWIGFGKEGLGEDGIPYWYSFNEKEKSIFASVEPGGLHIATSNMDEKEWEQWISKFKAKATRILGFKVGEIELGEVGHEIEWL